MTDWQPQTHAPVSPDAPGITVAATGIVFVSRLQPGTSAADGALKSYIVSWENATAANPTLLAGSSEGFSLVVPGKFWSSRFPGGRFC